MRKNLLAAVLIVMSIPSLALASVATVPEPASFLLVGAGLIGLGIIRKKREGYERVQTIKLIIGMFF